MIVVRHESFDGWEVVILTSWDAALFMIREDWERRAEDGWRPNYVDARDWEYQEIWEQLKEEVWGKDVESRRNHRQIGRRAISVRRRRETARRSNAQCAFPHGT